MYIICKKDDDYPELRYYAEDIPSIEWVVAAYIDDYSGFNRTIISYHIDETTQSVYVKYKDNITDDELSLDFTYYKLQNIKEISHE